MKKRQLLVFIMACVFVNPLFGEERKITMNQSDTLIGILQTLVAKSTISRKEMADILNVTFTSSGEGLYKSTSTSMFKSISFWAPATAGEPTHPGGSLRFYPMDANKFGNALDPISAEKIFGKPTIFPGREGTEWHDIDMYHYGVPCGVLILGFKKISEQIFSLEVIEIGYLKVLAEDRNPFD